MNVQHSHFGLRPVAMAALVAIPESRPFSYKIPVGTVIRIKPATPRRIAGSGHPGSVSDGKTCARTKRCLYLLNRVLVSAEL